MLSQSSAAMRGSGPARADTRLHTRSLRVRTRASTPETETVKAFARTGERLSKFALAPNAQGHSTFAALRFVRDHLRRRFAHLNLGAHFLDLRGLLFQLRNHGLHFAF